MALASVLHLTFRRAVRKPQRPSWERLKKAFAKAEAAASARTAIVLKLPDRKPRSAVASAAAVLPSPKRRTLEEEELLQQEINGCKALLLEIVRRAAYDWVLYRGSHRLLHKTLAEHAYHWMFVERDGGAEWTERGRHGKHITSFVGICEGLGLDVDLVRKHIKRLTPKNVLSVGRPAEYRRREVFSSSGDDSYSLPESMASYGSTEDTGEEETVG